MRRFDYFKGQPSEFWAKVRFISQELGYTKRRADAIRTYSVDEIVNLFLENGDQIDIAEAEELSKYSEMRCEAVHEARNYLMDAKQAEEVYAQVSKKISWAIVPFSAPMNKQKGEKRNVAFLTALVDLIAFDVLSDYGLEFDHDPRCLLEFYDLNHNLVSVSSRRLDGAFPSTRNPEAVWEIKEYYYTTTFGSRIADGVYETRLDGYELNDAEEQTARKTTHILFVDSYSTWWEQGKSYFCRLIDMLNEGSVDEIIFGYEVLTRWPEVLREIIES